MNPKTQKVKPIPEGFHALTPILTQKNCSKAIEFYKKAFGAEVMDLLKTPDGKGTMHASVKIGDSMLMMGDEFPEKGCASAETLGGSPVALYLYVPNVDAAFKQAIAAGGESIMPVEDMFWGDRAGMLKDPFGYTWWIGTHTRDLSTEEIEQGAREACAKEAKA